MVIDNLCKFKEQFDTPQTVSYMVGSYLFLVIYAYIQLF